MTYILHLCTLTLTNRIEKNAFRVGWRWGVVARDEHGQVMLAAWKALALCARAKEAEMACKEGMTPVSQLIYAPCVLGIDCVLMIEFLPLE